MSRLCVLFIIMMVFVLGLAPEMGLTATGMATTTVVAGDVKGTVSDATGKPMAGVAVKLLKDGKMVVVAISDKAGHFALERIEASNYELLMPGMNPLPFNASDRSGLTVLKVVLPIERPYAAAETGFLGIYDWVIMSFEETPVIAGLVGAGVVAAIAVPIAVNNDGSSGGDTISP